MTQIDAEPTRGSLSVPSAEIPRPRVLLVDDQPARLLTYETILEGVGVDCVRALSGEEALDRLLRDRFALILLDVSMPGMDGLETARLIREHPRFERTPIIFVTGVHVTQLDSLRGYEVGAIDYISVPIVPEILRSKVALLVELYRRRAELELLNRDLEKTRARLEEERSKTLAVSQARLRESEQRYRAIFEHPTALTVVLEAVRDESGDIVDWQYVDANAIAINLLGHSREALLNMRLREAEPERAKILMPLCCRVLADRSPHRYEMKFGDADYLMCLFPMGKDALVRSGVDISARIRAERETRRLSDADRAEKEWLSAVLNSMNEEVYFTDVQKRYTYANPAAHREFGAETLEGLEVDKLAASLVILRPDGTPRPPEESPPLRSLAGEIIRDEEQLVSIPRTGELRHRQVSSAPVRDGTGKIIGSVSVVRDITDQRRADAALRRSEQQLRDADRRKDEFIAMLAHELRNPLVPIRTGVELLKKARERTDIIDTVQPMMERQLGHMVRMIDDLLEVSRITSGKLQLQCQPTMLSSIIGSAIESNRDAITAGKLELSVNLPEPQWMLHVDPTRLVQVIANLVQNATKYTPPGGRIVIDAAMNRGSDANSSELVLRVIDSGEGISEAMLPRIFDLFAQASTAGHGGRSGLG
ncbi:MAG TPA: response regulator, partial [Steroidobacteraceae bacterium]